MGNRRVFIGWSGEENREIACRISNELSSANYFPIIGGEWKASLTVSEEIIHQMNACDFAIILIERETRKNDKGEIISIGFNPNVMMEMGYMLHKVSDPNHIRRILINMKPSDLPSDLQGAWSIDVKKKEYAPDDEEAREESLDAVVKAVTEDFFSFIRNVQIKTNKLDYFDNWDENVLDIYRYDGDTRISEKLIYGMQAAIYSGEYEKLYKKLGRIKDQLVKKDRFGDYNCVACAIAILDVFVVTQRLTKPLDAQQFDDLWEALSHEYEKNFTDRDLKAWCEIFRTDKQELCCELFAESIEDNEEKIEYYYDALELCYKILSMIEAHLNSLEEEEVRQKDAKYALLYKAFSNRNISQIHKVLSMLEEDKAQEHREKQKEYCAKTLEIRKELYDYYNGGVRENFLSMDFITQEYILALAEQYRFEEARMEKRRIAQTVRGIYNKWRDKNKIRNMILEIVEKEAKDFL